MTHSNTLLLQSRKPSPIPRMRTAIHGGGGGMILGSGKVSSAKYHKSALRQTQFTMNHRPLQWPSPRPPIIHRSPYARKASAATLRYHHDNRSKLYTIREESSPLSAKVREKNSRRGTPLRTTDNVIDSVTRELEGAIDFGNDTYGIRSLLNDEASDENDDDDDNYDMNDSDLEGWDDETTLVARLQLGAPERSEKDALRALAHALEEPMQAQGNVLKQYLVHTIAPSARRVKEVHQLIEDRVDVPFGVGVLSFDDTCKEIESMTMRDQDDIKKVYFDTQRKIKDLFSQLKDAYNTREQLWVFLREAVDKSAAQTIASLSAVESDIDEVAAVLDKRAKEVTKSTGGDGKAKEKMLRDLLAGM